MQRSAQLGSVGIWLGLIIGAAVFRAFHYPDLHCPAATDGEFVCFSTGNHSSASEL